MIDLGNGRAAGQKAVVPTPACIRPRCAPEEQTAARPVAGGVGLSPVAPAIGPAGRAGGPAVALAVSGSGRAATRDALEAALSGVELAGRDRQFLTRLVHWDKRNAASVVSLLHRARQAGRQEAALTPRQLETVLAALGDAARYRSSGLAATGCWDCENIPGGRCAEHAKDNDRARAYAELATALATDGGTDGLSAPRGLSGYLRRRPVAS
jgi:hypothetical protein